MTTRLETLGGLRIHRDGTELVALPGRRIQCALLVYLAVERRATRDSMMTLLWPEKDTDRARRSLNNTAYELRGELGEDWVASQGDLLVVSDSITTDVALLEQAVDEGRFDDAAELVAGDFLEGYHLMSTPDFESWVDRLRARVGRLSHRVRREGVTSLVSAGDPEAALRAARAWTDQAGLDDEANYWLIRLLAETGHTADALRAYERFRAQLVEEYDVEPQETVRELVEQIRAGEVSGLETAPSARGRTVALDGTAPPRAPPRFDLASERPDPSVDTARGPADAIDPDRVWRPEEGWAKKLITALSLYAVPAAGLLQVLDYLIDYAGLPRSFFPAALVLIVGGVPIVMVTAFLESQPVPRRDVRGIRFLVARWFRWKNAALGAIAATAAWTAAVVGWLLVAPPQSLDPNRVVVFPLATTASIPDPTAGWDVALAIGGALEHTEPLKFIDGRDWLEAPYRDAPSDLTPQVAATVARERGAGLYVHGALRAEGDSLFVVLRVHDVAGDSLITRETVAGSAALTSAPRLALDGMRAILVRLVEPSQSANLEALSDRTAGSFALWLQGERAYRQSQFADALDFFQRAVAEDSAHAYAAIKGAQAASWSLDVEAATELIELALRNEASLPPKYRSLARGFQSYLEGDAAGAAAAFRTALRADDRWSEAAMALGETYYHLLPDDAANSDSVAGAWFERAWRNDRGFAPPLYHLAQVRIRAGDLAGASEAIESWRAFQPDPVLLAEVESALACVTEGPRDYRWDVDEHGVRPVLQAAHELAGAAAHPDCAEEAFRVVFDRDFERPLRWTALKGLYGLAVTRGRYADADSLLQVAVSTDIRAARTLYIFGYLAGAPFEARSAEVEAGLRDALGDTYAGTLTRWRWLMGVWLASSGQLERLERLQHEIAEEAAGDREAALLATSLAAHHAAARGDTTAARSILRELEPTGPRDFLTFQESESLAPERLLLARLLQERGDYAGAFRVASLIDHRAPDIYPLFLAESLRIRLRAARSLGDPALVEDIEDRLLDLGHSIHD